MTKRQDLERAFAAISEAIEFFEDMEAKYPREEVFEDVRNTLEELQYDIQEALDNLPKTKMKITFLLEEDEDE